MKITREGDGGVFHPMKAINQFLCFDILDTGGATRPFQSKKSQLTKIQNMYYLIHHITVDFLISNRIIFRLDCFQLNHPPVIPTIHTIISIEYIQNICC